MVTFENSLNTGRSRAMTVLVEDCVLILEVPLMPAGEQTARASPGRGFPPGPQVSAGGHARPSLPLRLHGGS